MMLALRNPDVYRTFGDYSGLLGPRSGDSNAIGSTVTDLFRGDQAAFDAHEPSDIMRKHSSRSSEPGSRSAATTVTRWPRRRAGPPSPRRGDRHLCGDDPRRRAHVPGVGAGVPRLVAVDRRPARASPSRSGARPGSRTRLGQQLRGVRARTGASWLQCLHGLAGANVLIPEAVVRARDVAVGAGCAAATSSGLA